jgi:MFS family permease
MDAEPAPQKLLVSLRSLPGPAWVLFAGTFVNRIGTFVLPFFTLYLTGKGFSAPQAGGAIAAYGLGGLVAQLFGGLLADRIGRRDAIGLSMIGSGALTLALWQAESLALIAVLMFAVACVGEIHRPASGALIADLVPPEGRVAAFTMFRLTFNVGWAVGLALGGILAERSFDILFVGDAATAIAFGVFSLLALPHGTRSTSRAEVDLPSARASILADRGFLLFLASAFLGGTIYAQNVSSLPMHVRDAGFGPGVYGALQSLNGALVVVLELPIIAWVQRHERLRMLALAQVLLGLGFATLLVADTLPLLVGMVVVWTLGEIVGASPATAVAADRAPEYARGRYQSALGVAWSSAFMVGPLLGTIAYEASPPVLWWACGAAGVAAAALSLSARRHPAPAIAGPAPVDAAAT